jgi:endonuclease-3
MSAMARGVSTNTIVRVLQTLSLHQGKTMLARIGTGRPFATLIATILSARARDEVTEGVANELLRAYPKAEMLARASVAAVQRRIRRIGLYRIKSRRLVEVARALVQDHRGRVPNDLEALMRLPGVGRKTAGCVVVYAFGGTALPVDTHVHRISNRLGWVHTTTPEKTEESLRRIVPRRWWSRVNDLLVSHGKTTCKPQRPLCLSCPVRNDCPWPNSARNT